MTEQHRRESILAANSDPCSLIKFRLPGQPRARGTSLRIRAQETEGATEIESFTVRPDETRHISFQQGWALRLAASYARSCDVDQGVPSEAYEDLGNVWPGTKPLGSFRSICSSVSTSSTYRFTAGGKSPRGKRRSDCRHVGAQAFVIGALLAPGRSRQLVKPNFLHPTVYDAGVLPGPDMRRRYGASREEVVVGF